MSGLESVVGATMSKFAKYQTQANCQECPADLAYFAPNRGKDSNMTKVILSFESARPKQKNKNRRICDGLNFLVGAKGFEPSTSWSQTKHSTRLSYTPKRSLL